MTRWLALLVVLALPLVATACPTCREAVTQTTDADAADQYREAAGYNASIYLMLGVPLASVSVVGFLVYRGLQRPASHPANHTGPATSGPPRE